MNKWIGIGRLTRDPELRRTGTGKAVASFTVAVDDGYGDNKTTDFIDIVTWEKTAENCAKYLTKGAKVAVTGKLKKRSYEKDGRTVWVSEIKANEVEFLETRAAHPASTAEPAQYPGNFAVMDDDDDAQLPF